MDATLSLVMSLAQVFFLFCAYSITKLSTDLFTNTQSFLVLLRISTEDTTMDGLEVFSQWPHQWEDMILKLTKLVISCAKTTGERMPNLLSSRMDTIRTSWTLDLEKPGDSGTGKKLNAEDGLSGDTSIPTITEEPGPGSIANLVQTAAPNEGYFKQISRNDLFHLIF